MAINSNILAIIRNGGRETADSILKAIADNVKARRLSRNITQKAFAARVGLPLSTYRRFEDKGEISLKGLAKIAIVLEEQPQLKQLFEKQEYASLDEMLASKKPRKRGKINE